MRWENRENRENREKKKGKSHREPARLRALRQITKNCLVCVLLLAGNGNQKEQCAVVHASPGRRGPGFFYESRFPSQPALGMTDEESAQNNDKALPPSLHDRFQTRHAVLLLYVELPSSRALNQSIFQKPTTIPVQLARRSMFVSRDGWVMKCA